LPELEWLHCSPADYSALPPPLHSEKQNRTSTQPLIWWQVVSFVKKNRISFAKILGTYISEKSLFFLKKSAAADWEVGPEQPVL
jgi:hypothetical protein